MAAFGNRTQRILQLESSTGVVECRSTLCKQLFKQGPSMHGCSCHGGSRGACSHSAAVRIGFTDVCQPFDAQCRTKRITQVIH
jgi:hypothetical protein